MGWGNLNNAHMTGGFEHSVWGGGRGVRNTAVLGCLRQAALVQKSSGSSVILSCASTGKLKKLDMQPARHVAMCP